MRSSLQIFQADSDLNRFLTVLFPVIETMDVLTHSAHLCGKHCFSLENPYPDSELSLPTLLLFCMWGFQRPCERGRKCCVHMGGVASHKCLPF